MPGPITETGNKPCYGTSQPTLSCDAISAQAAIDQAAAVWWQFGVGALTLGAAVAAALYAKNAADQTKRGADEAKRSADAAERALTITTTTSSSELRPWIKATVEIRSIAFSPEKLEVSLIVNFENIGRTVAKKVTSYVSTKVTPDAVIDEVAAAEFARLRQMMSADHVNLIPGDVVEFRSETWQSVSNAPWTGEPPAITFMILAVAVYESELGEYQHATEQSFRIGKKDGDIFTSRLILRSMEGCTLDDIHVRRSVSGEVS